MKNVASVNSYLANLALWNIKLHNLHFNVEGKNFKNIHEFLEDIYEEVFEYYDAVAELMKQQDQIPNCCMKSYLETATMKEMASEIIPIQDALKILVDDLELMIAQAKQVRAEAGEEDNFLLSNMMEDHVEYYAKQLWFTRSFLSEN